VRGCEKERLIIALISTPRLNARALLTVLPYQIKRLAEEEFYKEYVSETLRYSGKCISRLIGGEYMPKPCRQLLHPVKELTAAEIVEQTLARIK
jgi:hypothetical protein